MTLFSINAAPGPAHCAGPGAALSAHACRCARYWEGLTPVAFLKNVEKAAAEANPSHSATAAAVQPPSSQFLAASIFSCTIYLCGVSSISCRKQRLRRLKDKPEQICRDIEKYCPNAWLLNHNPMVGLTMLHSLGSSVKNVGICHGVQTTAHEVAEFLGLKDEEVTYRVAGINHLAWFLELQRTDSGKDLYPLLRQTLANPLHPGAARRRDSTAPAGKPRRALLVCLVIPGPGSG